jgi:hypothetical protein
MHGCGRVAVSPRAYVATLPRSSHDRDEIAVLRQRDLDGRSTRTVLCERIRARGEQQLHNFEIASCLNRSVQRPPTRLASRGNIGSRVQK